MAYNSRARLCLAHMGQARGQQPWRIWQRVCALALCTTSSLLFLFASICLATGSFHHGPPHQAHHHHHTGPDAQHASGLLDICDFAHQALTTTVVSAVPLLPGVLLLDAVLWCRACLLLPLAPVTRHGIRAPPLVHA